MVPLLLSTPRFSVRSFPSCIFDCHRGFRPSQLGHRVMRLLCFEVIESPFPICSGVFHDVVRFHILIPSCPFIVVLSQRLCFCFLPKVLHSVGHVGYLPSGEQSAVCDGFFDVCGYVCEE